MPLPKKPDSLRMTIAPSPGGIVERAFELSLKKTRQNIEDLALAPTRSAWAFAVDGDFSKDKDGFFDIGNWTSGFFSGMALLAYQQTRDPFFIAHTKSLYPAFRDKLRGEHALNTMHDLGFLYSPFAVMLYQITGDTIYRDLALEAANLLSGRFIAQGGYFRAWGRMDDPTAPTAGLTIIDSLMNMPLLHWASINGGSSQLSRMAQVHTETLLRHLVRDDGSVRHAFQFDPRTGEPIGIAEYCGRRQESHWARGTAWAMYGLALGYRYTGIETYLKTCQRITDRFLDSLEEGIVPYWDFELGPEVLPLRDASAASIALCALQELNGMGKASEKARQAKDALLETLCSEAYLDFSPSVRGIQRQGQIGGGSAMAQNAYTSWGDYFLMEALTRELGTPVTWW